jgi:hypothetical protein
MKPQQTEEDFVFNVVITPGTFRYLAWFARSLLAHSAIRLRLVANHCPPAELDAMRTFADSHEPRVQVFDLDCAHIAPHGTALDETFAAHDDGDLFCFVDSDVMATRPFMPSFLDLLRRFDVVTSGSVSWSDDTVLPAGERRLAGRHVVGTDGFVYGASYLAIYPRRAVEHGRDRWGVGLRAGSHEQLPDAAQRRLESMQRVFELYDTGKALNILLQGDGFTLAHVENPSIVHIGGISQSVSRPEAGSIVLEGAGRARLDFASWAAATLHSLVDGQALPPLPLDDETRARAEVVQRDLLALARDFAS